MKSAIALIAAAVLLVPLTATGQDYGEVDEIVVTGSRLAGWGPEEVPQVRLTRRADNLVIQVQVICDTRDPAQRRAELLETLRNMARAAAGRDDIDLSTGSDILSSFDETMAGGLTIGVDRTRADTSVVTLTIKTPVRADDTLDAATTRIERFVAQAPKAGRTEILMAGDWELTLVGPDRYRGEILTAIASDARRTADAFGDRYAVQVEGLEHRVTWTQSGPLDLSLFIPYQLTVTPAGS